MPDLLCQPFQSNSPCPMFAPDRRCRPSSTHPVGLGAFPPNPPFPIPHLLAVGLQTAGLCQRRRSPTRLRAPGLQAPIHPDPTKSPWALPSTPWAWFSCLLSRRVGSGDLEALPGLAASLGDSWYMPCWLANLPFILDFSEDSQAVILVPTLLILNQVHRGNNVVVMCVFPKL